MSLIVRHHHQDCEASTSSLIFKGLAHKNAWKNHVLPKRLNLFVQKGKVLLIKAQSTGRKSRLTTIYILKKFSMFL